MISFLELRKHAKALSIPTVNVEPNEIRVQLLDKIRDSYALEKENRDEKGFEDWKNENKDLLLFYNETVTDMDTGDGLIDGAPTINLPVKVKKETTKKVKVIDVKKVKSPEEIAEEIASKVDSKEEIKTILKKKKNKSVSKATKKDNKSKKVMEKKQEIKTGKVKKDTTTNITNKLESPKKVNVVEKAAKAKEKAMLKKEENKLQKRNLKGSSVKIIFTEEELKNSKFVSVENVKRVSINHFLEVVFEMVDSKRSCVDAVKFVAQRNNVSISTITDQVSRQIGMKVVDFVEMVKDKNEVLKLVSTKWPKYEKEITETLNTIYKSK